MNSRLEIIAKEQVEQIEVVSFEDQQTKKLAEFSFEGLSIGTDDDIEKDCPKLVSQEDTLSQFDFGSLSLEGADEAEENIGTLLVADKQEEIRPNPVDPGVNVNKAGLANFDLAQYGLMEKEVLSRRVGIGATKDNKAAYKGPERRVADRRAQHDRRNEARFHVSDRRESNDRRILGSSPWSEGYSI